jgi:capsular exopolysaccharide synthesis family protein
VGKIANALDKYTDERRVEILAASVGPPLTPVDIEVLVAYDQKTGHLLRCDPETGQVDENRIEELQSNGTILRLLHNQLIHPGGKLTAKGVEEARRLATLAGALPRRAAEGEANETRLRKDLELSAFKTPQIEPRVTENSVREILPVRMASIENGPRALWDEARIDKKLVALLDPQSLEAEQFKILRTNILFPLVGQPPRSILLTSTTPGEGKTFSAANLAISIALNINRHVLLIDADLRKPQLHALFGFPTVPGLSNYLAEDRPLSSYLLHTKVEKLTLLPAGPPPENPSELISSERMANLLEEVSHRYPDRLIVIDAPPPAMAAETGVLARQVDGILVVVLFGATRRRDLSDLISLMGEKKILGSIVNRVETASSRYYGYKYGGYKKAKR